jgi:hypothetical protein
LRSGDEASHTGSDQIVFSYNGTTSYSHAIKTRHNSFQDPANSIDFYVWDHGTDAVDAVGTKHVMSLNGGNVGIGTASPGYPLEMASGARCTAGGVWTDASSVALKENFSEVDTAEILAKLEELPIRRWNYKAEDATVKHMGPVAEDFHLLFGLGDSDKAISGVDRSGVALAAIQGLYRIMQEKEAEIAELKDRLSQLESTMAESAREQKEGV